jgi:hypothetical protein
MNNKRKDITKFLTSIVTWIAIITGYFFIENVLHLLLAMSIYYLVYVGVLIRKYLKVNIQITN